MKVQVCVEIPDGYELACDEMRPPKALEFFLDSTDLSVVQADCPRHQPRVIVRPAWQWPSWLKAAAIAMEDDGGWFAFDDVPKVGGAMWSIGDDIGTHLSERRFDFTPPHCTDWRQSLRLNPNREAKS